MTDEITIDRIAPTRRPSRKPIGYHCWRNLLFLHWRVPAEQIRPLIPNELTLDTFEGDAWIGLVPFEMRNIRPRWSPPVPGISNFLETNVRTYVHREGHDPGVWFFSLDASSRLAVTIARWRWSLNYHFARMTLNRTENQLHYRSQRTAADQQHIVSEIRASVETNADALHSAEPGTLEHFLVERYLLYSAGPTDQPGKSRLFRGQVYHPSYQIGSIELMNCEESLLLANGIAVDSPSCSTLYCPGVEVEIFPLEQINE